MGRALVCAQGHRWESQDDALSSEGSICPVCGSESQATTLDGYGTGSTPVPALPSYEILEEIGRGGMGVVYRARHNDSGRIVALKIIRKDRLTQQEIVSRFRREAQAAARLSHLNIVLVHESAQENGLDYLAMEYVPGLTLQAYVNKHGALSVDHACDYLRQTSQGLQHAHEQGLIHRDIKPANLMLAGDDSSRKIVKILDMGVARLRQLEHLQDESLTTLTQHGSILGTPDYIAPEQLENPSAVDIRADIYSLGCTAYFLLTGQVPFPGGTMIQKLDRQRWEVAPAVNQLRPEIPTALATVIRRMMAKSPDDRYQTPHEVAQALEDLERTGFVSLTFPHQSISPARHWKGHEGGIHCLGFLPRARQLISGGQDRMLRWWKLSDDEPATEIRRIKLPQEITTLAIAPGEKHLLIATGATLRLLESDTGKEVQRFMGHLDAVRSVCFSHDGKSILSGGDDRIVRLWDIQRGRVYERLQGHRNGINGLAMSPDDAWVVTGSRDQTLRIWDARKGREVRQLPVPQGNIFDVAFSGDGRQVISAHFDTTIRAWDHQSGRELRRFQGHRRIVSALVCAPDGGTIISAGHDEVIRFWDCASGIEKLIGEGHPHPITCLAISSEGSWIASGDTTGNLCLWKSGNKAGQGGL